MEVERDRSVEVQVDRERITVSNRGSAPVRDPETSLFSPFKTSKARTLGPRNLGLGLYFVESVARAHEATVSYTHEAGVTRFVVAKASKTTAAARRM